MKQMEIFRASAQQKDEKYNPLMRVKVASQGSKVPKVFVQKQENGKNTSRAPCKIRKRVIRYTNY